MKKLLPILLVAAALGGCKKDSDSATPATSTPTDLLTAKNWRISAENASVVFTGISTTPVVQDEYASMSTCERDDFTKFNTNKSVTVDEGVTKCNTTDPQTQTGSWSLNAANTQLTLTEPSMGTIVFDVVTLSATTLSIKNTTTSSSGGVSIASTENITFTAF